MSEMRCSPGQPSAIRSQNTDNAILRLEADLEIIQFRLYQLAGTKPVAESASNSTLVVGGVKKGTEEKKYADSEPADKLLLLEKLLTKMSEFDREILKKTTSSSVPEAARRKSIHADLFTLPSHLIIVDRLLDLFNQSQRMNFTHSTLQIPSIPIESPRQKIVTILSASDIFASNLRTPKLTPLSSFSDMTLLEEKSKNIALQTKLEETAEQLSTTAHLLFTAQVAAQDCKNDVVTLQVAMTKSSSLNVKLQEIINQQPPNIISECETFPKEDRKILKDKILSMEKININLQERLDIEVAANQSIRTALMAATINLNNDEVSLNIGSPSLVGKNLLALQSFSEGLMAYTEKKFNSVNRLEETISTITTQLNNYISSRSALQEDYNNLVFNNEIIVKNEKILLEKFNTMEFNYEQQLIKNRVANEIQREATQINIANALLLKDEKSKFLEASLATSVAQCSELEMKKKFLIAENHSQDKKKEVALLNEEMKVLSKVIENLKTKMKNMSKKDAPFMDSFEEVMKDEMTAMKWAYEAKLKVANEKADAMAVRHAQEIESMQQKSLGSPSPSLNFK